MIEGVKSPTTATTTTTGTDQRPAANLDETMADGRIDVERHKFPFCVVWTPLPVITWLFPFIGHMGICTSSGVIRDFAGPYYVSEDDMAFGWPTKYWQLHANDAQDGVHGWNAGVAEASEIYKGRMHNLFCDNCHSHVAKALTLMRYEGKENWTMVSLAINLFFCGKFVGFGGFLQTWLPFFILISTIILLLIATTVGF